MVTIRKGCVCNCHMWNVCKVNLMCHLENGPSTVQGTQTISKPAGCKSCKIQAASITNKTPPPSPPPPPQKTPKKPQPNKNPHKTHKQSTSQSLEKKYIWHFLNYNCIAQTAEAALWAHPRCACWHHNLPIKPLSKQSCSKVRIHRTKKSTWTHYRTASYYSI